MFPSRDGGPGWRIISRQLSRSGRTCVRYQGLPCATGGPGDWLNHGTACRSGSGPQPGKGSNVLLDLADHGSWGPTASGKEIALGLKVFNAAREHSDEVAGAVLPIRRDLLITSSDAASREAAIARVRRRYKTYADWGLFAEGRTSLASDEPGHAAPVNGPILGTINECADALRSLQDSIPIEALVIFRLSWPGMERREILTQIRLVADQLAPQLSDLNSEGSPTTLPAS